MINYLSYDELVRINREVVGISGDPHGVMIESNLFHLLDTVELKYDDRADAVLLKAAFMLDYLANKGHVFIEGNKRTAETATILFLRMNGFLFEERDQKNLTAYVLKVARNEESLTSVFKWLKQRIKKTV